MFIRLFAKSDNKELAISIFNSAISSIENIILKKEIVKAESYWKMDGVYVIEANIEFNTNLNEGQLKEFQYSIADKWLFFGNPVDEVLASDTTEECSFFVNGVKMINIFY